MIDIKAEAEKVASIYAKHIDDITDLTGLIESLCLRVREEERERAEFYKAEWTQIKSAFESEAVEEFIQKNLKWSEEASEHEKALVAGNIRNFALWAKGLNRQIKPLAATNAQEKP